MAVLPQDAITKRHPLEVKAAEVISQQPWAQRAANPQNRVELVLTVLLGLASLVLGIYFMMILYKCVCPRNYAKWRSSWGTQGRTSRERLRYQKKIRESVPLLLQGHNQAVDCVVTDGPLVVTSCLGGELRVWDSTSGECHTVIDRQW